MSNVSDCQTCGGSNLLINIWGFPIEDALNELEKSGYEVNLMGCEPPLKDEEVFIYQCKDCGERFGAYEDEYQLYKQN